jgi:NAD(P)-dependent dehydrogenase (short-subunit alcohol dehydrogenase family)
MQDNGGLSGKVAVVTGAGQGIGAVFAQSLAREGARVVVADVVDVAKCMQMIKSAGGACIGTKTDITASADLVAMVSAAEKEFGPINILVNNAAIFTKLQLKPFLQMSDEEWDRVMTVNARAGPFRPAKLLFHR